jgi:hypothetical protein
MLDEESAIGRPGSTCIVDWKRELTGKSKLIVADIDAQGCEFTTETLNDVREFKFLTGLDVTGMGAEEINSTLKNRVDQLSVQKKGKPIIIMKVEGLLTPETESSIERNGLIKYGESKLNPLIFHIEPNWEIIGSPLLKLSEPLNMEKSVLEYMTAKGLKDIDAIVSGLHVLSGGD